MLVTIATRPTLLLEKGQSVYNLVLFRKGIVRGHNFGTGRYMLELEPWENQRLCEKYVYWSRDQIVKRGR